MAQGKFRLFGHVLRASPADPLVQVTFKTDGLTPRAPTRRRPGRPKADWTTEAYKDAYGILHGDANAFGVNNIQHLNEIKQSARNRPGPSAA